MRATAAPDPPCVIPPRWSVPRAWVGERCFVLCSGESVGPQRAQIARLRGRIIAVKHGVLTRPDADVLFLSGERSSVIARVLIPQYRGACVVVRGRWHPDLPDTAHQIGRSKFHDTLSEDPTAVTGRDTGTSAINLAALFGATEIVLLGYDMTGGHFCEHPLPYPPVGHFTRHMTFLPQLAAVAQARGIRIVNCSPTSTVTCFERRPLEAYL